MADVNETVNRERLRKRKTVGHAEKERLTNLCLPLIEFFRRSGNVELQHRELQSTLDQESIRKPADALFRVVTKVRCATPNPGRTPSFMTQHILKILSVGAACKTYKQSTRSKVS